MRLSNLLTGLTFSLFFLPAVTAAQAAAKQAELANNLLASMDDTELEAAALPWDSADRTEWTYFPWGHAGVALSEMTPRQREHAFALLHSALSEDGRERALQVIELEIDEAQKGFISRFWTDGEGYYSTVFGAPGTNDPWSWRFEGHHLSVNLTYSGDELLSGTPYFIGADPAQVSEGPLAGMRILEAEEVDARALFLSLDEGQRKQARIDSKAPRDILTGSEPIAELPCCKGVAFPELDKSQQGELLALVDLVAGQLHPAVADIHLSRMHAAGVQQLTFAWAGSRQQGEGHYYRIQGPTLLIEYGNTQNDANHIHLVLRDPERDFGGDLLQEHLAAGH